MAHEGGTNWVGLALLGVGAYFVYEWWVSSSTTATATTGTATATPGTTQAGTTTSVSTAPSTTTAMPSGTMQTLALNMEQVLNSSSANADQWNWAVARILGQGLDQKYNFAFDSVYGSVVNGVRNNGATMSALTFLQLAASAVGGLPGLSGLGSAIARFPGHFFNTTGNMIYLAHHPLPYTPTYNLRGFRGLGAFTQASGFEKALWAGRPLRSNRIR